MVETSWNKNSNIRLKTSTGFKLFKTLKMNFHRHCCLFISHISEFCLDSLFHSYDSEGRLTNVTYPTGVVTSLHREMEESINIDMESSNRDDDVTVITNLSSVEASYTVVQGTHAAHKEHISVQISC